MWRLVVAVAVCSAAYAGIFVPPIAIHSAFGDSPSSIRISWHTTVNTTNSVVLYGLTSGNYTTKALGSSSSYLLSAGFDHHVTLNNLALSTKYYYVVGSDEGVSTEFTFTTAPAVGDTNKNFTILVYADMGVEQSVPTIQQLNKHTEKADYDWVYHAGDISYADDYPGPLYEAVWNEWFEMMQRVLGYNVYMTCPGNHEHDCNHKECEYNTANFTAYNSKFRMPQNGSGNDTSMWFSFDYGMVHFISISTETDYPECPFDSVFGDQLSWLENDLANARKNNARWIIVAGHRPVYSSFAGFQFNGSPIEESKHIQAAFESLFFQYHVDLFLDGHVHSYERCYPVYNSTNVVENYDNPPYTTYITVGCAGNNEGHSWEFLGKPKWSAYREGFQYGYGRLEISYDQLQWYFHNADEDKVMDSFTITKS